MINELLRLHILREYAQSTSNTLTAHFDPWQPKLLMLNLCIYPLDGIQEKSVCFFFPQWCVRLLTPQFNSCKLKSGGLFAVRNQAEALEVPIANAFLLLSWICFRKQLYNKKNMYTYTYIYFNKQNEFMNLLIWRGVGVFSRWLSLGFSVLIIRFEVEHFITTSVSKLFYRPFPFVNCWSRHTANRLEKRSPHSSQTRPSPSLLLQGKFPPNDSLTPSTSPRFAKSPAALALVISVAPALAFDPAALSPKATVTSATFEMCNMGWCNVIAVSLPSPRPQGPSWTAPWKHTSSSRGAAESSECRWL